MSTAIFKLSRTVWLPLLIALCVLVPRGLLISFAQCERYDDEYHLNRGVAFWRTAIMNRPMNDPPLGQALSAIPLVLTGSYDANPAVDAGLYGHRVSPETLLNLVALWKSLLYLPLIAVAFLWVRELYGLRAAWLAVGLLLIEPTFAAHIPVGAIDVLGTQGIVIGCFAIWKYHQKPTLLRLALAALAIAAAMLTKNTAIILPGVAGAYALLWWVVLPIWRRVPWAQWQAAIPKRLAHVGIGAVLLALCIWGLTLFDVSIPMRRKDIPDFEKNPAVVRIFRKELPAGTYLRAVLKGIHHASGGHANFLNGQKGRTGQWEYFPIVATYKLPIGISAILLVGVASVAWRRPRFDEWSLALPAGIWTVMLLNQEVNIGFRHFLPALGFMLLLATRAIASNVRPEACLRDALADSSSTDMPPALPRCIRFLTPTLFALLAIAAVETLRVHPHYISYTNGLRPEPWRAISDSNLDWGQSLKSVRAWAAKQDRPVSLAFFGSEIQHTLDHYLKDTGVTVVLAPPFANPQPNPLPTTGLFVVSPTCLVGAYDRQNRLAPLWKETPIDTIDNSLLVYDLDAINAKEPIRWKTASQRSR